jgi:hypothetical protein
MTPSAERGPRDDAGVGGDAEGGDLADRLSADPQALREYIAQAEEFRCLVETTAAYLSASADSVRTNA